MHPSTCNTTSASRAPPHHESALSQPLAQAPRTASTHLSHTPTAARLAAQPPRDPCVGDQILLAPVSGSCGHVRIMLPQQGHRSCTAASLMHPHITATCPSIIVREPRVCVVPAALLRTLRLQSTRGPPQRPDWRDRVQQCIEAVDYCHRQNVAHRDLKLDNTLLNSCDPPHVKICDFGFAKLMGNNNLMTNIGTPVYMAPQQIQKGKKGYDGRAAGAAPTPSCGHALLLLNA